MESIHEAPVAQEFILLAAHQSQTPESFYTGPPVLYHHSPSAILKVHSQDLESAPALVSLFAGAQSKVNGHTSTNGHTEVEGEEEDGTELEVEDAAIWVTSEYSLHVLN